MFDFDRKLNHALLLQVYLFNCTIIRLQYFIIFTLWLILMESLIVLFMEILTKSTSFYFHLAKVFIEKL